MAARGDKTDAHEPANNAAPARMVELDGLRAFACVIVAYSHWSYGRDPFAGLHLPYGAIGIQIFFVLSGFLITGLLLEERARWAQGRSSPRRGLTAFFLKRVARILPVYVVALGLAMALAWPQLQADWPWYAGLIGNVRQVFTGDWNLVVGHFWSVNVEWQYYLVWPFVILFAPRAAFWPIFLTLIASAALWRPVLGQGLDVFAPQLLLPGSMDGLALGGLLAWRVREGEARGFVRACLGLGLVLTAYSWWDHVFRTPPHMAARASYVLGLSLIFVTVIDGARRGVSGPLGAVLRWAPVQALGQTSYGFYLFHLLPPVYLAPLVTELGFPELAPVVNHMAVLFLVTWAMAAVSWRMFEKPILTAARSWLARPIPQARLSASRAG